MSSTTTTTRFPTALADPRLFHRHCSCRRYPAFWVLVDRLAVGVLEPQSHPLFFGASTTCFFCRRRHRRRLGTEMYRDSPTTTFRLTCVCPTNQNQEKTKRCVECCCSKKDARTHTHLYCIRYAPIGIDPSVVFLKEGCGVSS